MIRETALAVLAGALLTHPAAAQDLTLDEVLANYYEAIGGLDAWQSVQSMRITGTMTMGRGMQAGFTRLVKRPDKVRAEFEIQGNAVVRAYDGQTAWMIMPMRGSGEPQVMNERQAINLLQDADIDGALVGWQESGHQVELEGLEETEGTEAYKLKVTLNSGDVLYYYMDSEYFVPIRIAGTRGFQGNTVEFATTLSDYKQVDGLLIAHSVQNSGGGRAPGGGGVGGNVTFDTVEINVDVDDSSFSMPEGGGGGGR